MRISIPMVAFRCLCGVIAAVVFCCGARGQESTETPADTVGVTPAGIQRFSPGGWSSVAVNGVNPTDADSEITVSVYLGDDSSLQFSKRFWVPARARRTTWLPILIPEDIPGEQHHVPMSSIRLNESDGGEKFTKNAVGMPITTRSLMLTESEINTAVMFGDFGAGGDGISSANVEQIYRTVHAGRDSTIDSSLGLSLIDLSDKFLPPTPRALDELDQIVIASDQILQDSAGVAQLRAWLFGGGRIWIMLDLAGEEVVRALAGDATSHTVVDRVALNDFQIESVDILQRDAAVESWSSETPVEMVRVLTDADEISCRVDGWPAAFWLPFGRGEMLLTTLGARGWLEGGKPTKAFHGLSTRFFELRNDPKNAVGAIRVPAAAMTPILDHQIGYSIPSRSWAGSVLGINALLILVAGCWWMRQRRLEKLAVLIPISAIAATAVLLYVGNRQVRAVPSTVAIGQIVRVYDSVDEANVSTICAIYSQDAADVELVSDYGTMTLPSAAYQTGGSQTGGTQTGGTQTGGTMRIGWDDSGSSEWKGSLQPPGVIRYAQSESTLSLSSPITARGTFDGNGLQARIEGLGSRRCEDGVIVSLPAPATAATISREGDSPPEFTAAAEGLLAPDQFIAGAVLSDVQQMRQKVLRQLLVSPQQNPFGSDPSILFWTDPMDVRMEVAERFQHRGTALACLPVLIDRPPSGTSYQIPATFIGVDTYIGSRGFSAVFQPRSGKWSQMSKSAETELVCRFPRSLAPMRLDRLGLQIKINAPSRSLVVKAKVDGQPTEVFRRANPSGTIDVTIDRADALELNEDGTWWMSIGVTETDAERDRLASSTDSGSAAELELTARAIDQADTSTWQIDFLHVTAAATSQ